ncbi:MAG: hypothetical protein GKS06_19880 [Acidobacteria bacterium]|nr:hypothetical protein [Acidobacteriota bacterium]
MDLARTHATEPLPSRVSASAVTSLALLVLAVPACGPMPGAPDEEANELALEHLATIGCEACGDARQLYVQAVHTDGRDRVYVLDRYEPLIRVFALDGTFTAAVGRQGEGPGEMQRPLFVFPGSGGEIQAVEMRPSRITSFTEHGAVSVEKFDRFPWSPTYSPFTDTFFFVGRANGRPRNETAIYEQLRDGTSVARIEWPDRDFPVGVDGQPTQHFSVTAGPNGELAVGDHGEVYRVRVYDVNGEFLRTHILDLGREVKTEQELAREREARRLESFRVEPRPIKLHYYGNAFAFDGTGRLWVRSGRSDAERTIYDVFAHDRYVGEIALPGLVPERRPWGITGDVFVDTFFAESGAHEVRVYRIVEAMR